MKHESGLIRFDKEIPEHHGAPKPYNFCNEHFTGHGGAYTTKANSIPKVQPAGGLIGRALTSAVELR